MDFLDNTISLTLDNYNTIVYFRRNRFHNYWSWRMQWRPSTSIIVSIADWLTLRERGSISTYRWLSQSILFSTLI